LISDQFFKRFYPDSSKDGAIAFYGWVRQFTTPSTVMLNLGAGPPAARGKIRVFKGEVARVIGADPDPEVKQNPELDEAHVIGPDGGLPFRDGAFDLVLSDWVVEHVPEPAKFLTEVRRVLRTGGSFFFRTPNKRHYVALIARMTPHWFHERIANWARGYPPGTHDPWPTVYRLNSSGVIEKEARNAGFQQIEIRMWEYEPGYLVFHPVPFLLGVAYERVVNRYSSLSGLRSSIFVRLVK
jgi:SAM-dependent methyltransferase